MPDKRRNPDAITLSMHRIQKKKSGRDPTGNYRRPLPKSRPPVTPDTAVPRISDGRLCKRREPNLGRPSRDLDRISKQLTQPRPGMHAFISSFTNLCLMCKVFAWNYTRLRRAALILRKLTFFLLAFGEVHALHISPTSISFLAIRTAPQSHTHKQQPLDVAQQEPDSDTATVNRQAYPSSRAIVLVASKRLKAPPRRTRSGKPKAHFLV